MEAVRPVEQQQQDMDERIEERATSNDLPPPPSVFPIGLMHELTQEEESRKDNLDGLMDRGNVSQLSPHTSYPLPSSSTSKPLPQLPELSLSYPSQPIASTSTTNSNSLAPEPSTQYHSDSPSHDIFREPSIDMSASDHPPGYTEAEHGMLPSYSHDRQRNHSKDGDEGEAGEGEKSEYPKEKDCNGEEGDDDEDLSEGYPEDKKEDLTPYSEFSEQDSHQMRNRDRNDLDKVQSAIDRAYTAAPQLRDQRATASFSEGGRTFEVDQSKVPLSDFMRERVREREREREEKSLTMGMGGMGMTEEEREFRYGYGTMSSSKPRSLKGKEKEREREIMLRVESEKELGKIWDHIERAHGHRTKEQAYEVDQERLAIKETKRRENFYHELVASSSSGRLVDQDHIPSPTRSTFDPVQLEPRSESETMRAPLPAPASALDSKQTTMAAIMGDIETSRELLTAADFFKEGKIVAFPPPPVLPFPLPSTSPGLNNNNNNSVGGGSLGSRRMSTSTSIPISLTSSGSGSTEEKENLSPVLPSTIAMSGFSAGVSTGNNSGANEFKRSSWKSSSGKDKEKTTSPPGTMNHSRSYSTSSNRRGSTTGITNSPSSSPTPTPGPGMMSSGGMILPGIGGNVGVGIGGGGSVLVGGGKGYIPLSDNVSEGDEAEGEGEAEAGAGAGAGVGAEDKGEGEMIPDSEKQDRESMDLTMALERLRSHESSGSGSGSGSGSQAGKGHGYGSASASASGASSGDERPGGNKVSGSGSGRLGKLWRRSGSQGSGRRV